jgi:hypothetical protein
MKFKDYVKEAKTTRPKFDKGTEVKVKLAGINVRYEFQSKKLVYFWTVVGSDFMGYYRLDTRTIGSTDEKYDKALKEGARDVHVRFKGNYKTPKLIRIEKHEKP